MSASSWGRSKDRVLYYYHDDIGNYHYGPGHPMKPHRIRLAHHLIQNYGLLRCMLMQQITPLESVEMTAYHNDDYVQFLKSVNQVNASNYQSEAGLKYNVREDCPLFEGVFEFSALSCGGSVDAAYAINRRDASIAINWSGGLHHAKRSEASGFCYINDIVLAILELLTVHQRVLYIDIDIHHGDGVEEAFYTTDRVMTLSFHKFGTYFPGTGVVQDIGIGRGTFYAANVPLQDGIDDDTYFNCVFCPIVDKVVEMFDPNAIVMQCGADSLTGDRLGVFNLTTLGHGRCVAYVKKLNRPLVMLGGGGYTIRNVSRCWTWETAIACGKEISNEIPNHKFFDYYAPDYALHIKPAVMENSNKPEQLRSIVCEVMNNLRQLPAVPSVQMHDMVTLPGKQRSETRWERIKMAIEDLGSDIRPRYRESEYSFRSKGQYNEEKAKEYGVNAEWLRANLWKLPNRDEIDESDAEEEHYSGANWWDSYTPVIMGKKPVPTKKRELTKAERNFKRMWRQCRVSACTNAGATGIKIRPLLEQYNLIGPKTDDDESEDDEFEQISVDKDQEEQSIEPSETTVGKKRKRIEIEQELEEEEEVDEVEKTKVEEEEEDDEISDIKPKRIFHLPRVFGANRTRKRYIRGVGFVNHENYIHRRFKNKVINSGTQNVNDDAIDEIEPKDSPVSETPLQQLPAEQPTEPLPIPAQSSSQTVTSEPKTEESQLQSQQPQFEDSTTTTKEPSPPPQHEPRSQHSPPVYQMPLQSLRHIPQHQVLIEDDRIVLKMVIDGHLVELQRRIQKVGNDDDDDNENTRDYMEVDTEVTTATEVTTETATSTDIAVTTATTTTAAAATSSAITTSAATTDTETMLQQEYNVTDHINAENDENDNEEDDDGEGDDDDGESDNGDDDGDDDDDDGGDNNDDDEDDVDDNNKEEKDEDVSNSMHFGKGVLITVASYEDNQPVSKLDLIFKVGCALRLLRKVPYLTIESTDGDVAVSDDTAAAAEAPPPTTTLTTDPDSDSSIPLDVLQEQQQVALLAINAFAQTANTILTLERERLIKRRVREEKAAADAELAAATAAVRAETRPKQMTIKQWKLAFLRRRELLKRTQIYSRFYDKRTAKKKAAEQIAKEMQQKQEKIRSKTTPMPTRWKYFPRFFGEYLDLLKIEKENRRRVRNHKRKIVEVRYNKFRQLVRQQILKRKLARMNEEREKRLKMATAEISMRNANENTKVDQKVSSKVTEVQQPNAQAEDNNNTTTETEIQQQPQQQKEKNRNVIHRHHRHRRQRPINGERYLLRTLFPSLADSDPEDDDISDDERLLRVMEQAVKRNDQSSVEALFALKMIRVFQLEAAEMAELKKLPAWRQHVLRKRKRSQVERWINKVARRLATYGVQVLMGDRVVDVAENNNKKRIKWKKVYTVGDDDDGENDGNVHENKTVWLHPHDYDPKYYKKMLQYVRIRLAQVDHKLARSTVTTKDGSEEYRINRDTKFTIAPDGTGRLYHGTKVVRFDPSYGYLAFDEEPDTDATVDFDTDNSYVKNSSSSEFTSCDEDMKQDNVATASSTNAAVAANLSMADNIDETADTHSVDSYLESGLDTDIDRSDLDGVEICSDIESNPDFDVDLKASLQDDDNDDNNEKEKKILHSLDHSEHQEIGDGVQVVFAAPGDKVELLYDDKTGDTKVKAYKNGEEVILVKEKITPNDGDDVRLIAYKIGERLQQSDFVNESLQQHTNVDGDDNISDEEILSHQTNKEEMKSNKKQEEQSNKVDQLVDDIHKPVNNEKAMQIDDNATTTTIHNNKVNDGNQRIKIDYEKLIENLTETLEMDSQFESVFYQSTHLLNSMFNSLKYNYPLPDALWKEQNQDQDDDQQQKQSKEKVSEIKVVDNNDDNDDYNMSLAGMEFFLIDENGDCLKDEGGTTFMVSNNDDNENDNQQLIAAKTKEVSMEVDNADNVDNGLDKSTKATIDDDHDVEMMIEDNNNNDDDNTKQIMVRPNDGGDILNQAMQVAGVSEWNGVTPIVEQDEEEEDDEEVVVKVEKATQIGDKTKNKQDEEKKQNVGDGGADEMNVAEMIRLAKLIGKNLANDNDDVVLLHHNELHRTSPSPLPPPPQTSKALVMDSSDEAKNDDTTLVVNETIKSTTSTSTTPTTTVSTTKLSSSLAAATTAVQKKVNIKLWLPPAMTSTSTTMINDNNNEMMMMKNVVKNRTIHVTPGANSTVKAMYNDAPIDAPYPYPVVSEEWLRAQSLLAKENITSNANNNNNNGFNNHSGIVHHHHPLRNGVITVSMQSALPYSLSSLAVVENEVLHSDDDDDEDDDDDDYHESKGDGGGGKARLLVPTTPYDQPKPILPIIDHRSTTITAVTTNNNNNNGPLEHTNGPLGGGGGGGESNPIDEKIVQMVHSMLPRKKSTYS